MVLRAQGFTGGRPGAGSGRRQLSRVLSRIRLLQLDSVNVAVRAHYVPLFSRLGPYSRQLLDAVAWEPTPARPRMLVEYWAHEACLLPVADWPLLRWRMRDCGGAWRRRGRELLEQDPQFVADVLAAVKELGPVGAGTVERELGADRPGQRGPWWDRSRTKRVCELLFATGELTTGARRNFERLYDLPERVLPAAVLAREPDEQEAVRELVERSARALGVATEADLRDYYRLGVQQCRAAVEDLVSAGVLEPVAVRGWRQRAYLHRSASAPREVAVRALLCPFDPLIWERSRVERLFGFRYRLEIYVPQRERQYGYYVFPFLWNDRLVARVDLKADRAAEALVVRGAFVEPGQPEAAVAAELAGALREMADWLELEDVLVADNGDLAGPLRAAVR